MNVKNNKSEDNFRISSFTLTSSLVVITLVYYISKLNMITALSIGCVVVLIVIVMHFLCNKQNFL